MNTVDLAVYAWPIVLLLAWTCGLVVCLALAGVAGRTERQDERRERFTRYDWQARGWFQ
jgi:hypothetical protein